MTDGVELRWVTIEEAQFQLLEDNPKLHDLEALKESIRKYGFRNPPIFDRTIGRVVSGNGRIQAVADIARSREPRPRGIREDDAGNWLMPILYGVDAQQAAEALAYAVDDNHLPLVGLTIADARRINDANTLKGLLQQIFDDDVDPVSTRENRSMWLQFADSYRPEPDILEQAFYDDRDPDELLLNLLETITLRVHPDVVSRFDRAATGHKMTREELLDHYLTDDGYPPPDK